MRLIAAVLFAVGTLIGQALAQVTPPAGPVDPRAFGAVGSSVTTTATPAGGSTATILAVGDWVNGEPVACFGCGPVYSLTTPSAPTVSFSGTAGSTTWYCKIEVVDFAFGISVASAEGSVGSAAATLDATDTITVSWSPVSNATAYIVLCGTSTGGETYVIGTTRTSFVHFGGLPAKPSWVPSTPLVAAQNQVLQTTILSGAGTTTLTLNNPTSGAGGYFIHDSTAAFQAAAATGLPLQVPCLTFNILAPVTFTTQGQGIKGTGWQCAILGMYTPASDMLQASARGVQFTNFGMDGTNSLDGYGIFFNGADKCVVDRVFFTHSPGLIKLTNSSLCYVSNIDGALVKGGTNDANQKRSLISAYSSGNSNEVSVFTLTNVVLGCPSINAIGFHANGQVDTSLLSTLAVTTCGTAIVTENTVGATGSSHPDFLTPAINVQAQTPMTDCFDFTTGQDLYLDYPFCNAAGGNGLVTGSTTSHIGVRDPIFSGINNAGIIFAGNNNTVDGGRITNTGKVADSCNQFANNYCPGVGVLSSSTDTKISHVTMGNVTSGGNQRYGVDVVSGAMQTILDGNNLVGNLVGDWINEAGANGCANSTATTIIVVDEGKCPIQGVISGNSGTTLSAATMTSAVPGAVANVDRIGTIGSGFNDQLGNAGAIEGVMSVPFAGFTWIMRLENNTNQIETVATSADTTTTAAGTKTVGIGQWRDFLCVITAIGGSPTVTCTGQ